MVTKELINHEKKGEEKMCVCVLLILIKNLSELIKQVVFSWVKSLSLAVSIRRSYFYCQFF